MKNIGKIILSVLIIAIVVTVGVFISNNSYKSMSGSVTVDNSSNTILIPSSETTNKKCKCELEANIDSKESPKVEVKFLGNNGQEYYSEVIDTTGISKINKDIDNVKGDLKIQINSNNANSKVNYSMKY